MTTPPPTSNPTEVPAAVIGYRLYCGGLLAIFGLIAPLIIWGMPSQPTPFENAAQWAPAELRPIYQDSVDREKQEAAQAKIGLTFILGVVAALLGISFLLPRSPGAWAYHTLMICLGLGGWLLPFSVILLINWFQPKVQAYFGRGVGKAFPPT